MTNKLVKKLEALKQEKEDLARQVEVEEEMITNALTKKLMKVRQEKVDLENQLEQEQEYIVNKLQKQLSTVLEEKRALEKQLREDTGAILQSIQHHLEQWRARAAAPGTPVSAPSPAPPWSGSTPASPRPPPSPSNSVPPLSPRPVPQHAPPPPPVDPSASDDDSSDVERTHLLVKHLTQEIDALGELQERYRSECEDQHRCNEALSQELSRLQAENAGLSHRVLREREIRDAALGEKARLEQEIEIDSERIFNSSSLSSARSSAPPSPGLHSMNAMIPPLMPPALLSPRSLAASLDGPGGRRSPPVPPIIIPPLQPLPAARASPAVASPASSLPLSRRQSAEEP